jgi:hypothetical protein
MIKSIVSGDRSRFKSPKHSLDLDLCYITPKILAMSIPSDSMLENYYRNSLEDVVKFFTLFHSYPHYLVVNLSQKRYDYTKLDNMVLEFGWKDHHGPPLRLLFQATLAVTAWHEADVQNVVAVHCKAGKGRTGTLISACLIFLGEADTAKEALEIFQRARAPKSKAGGVTMPSQIRYVEYFEQIICKGILPHKKILILKKIVISGAPEIDGGAFRPVFRILYENEHLISERKFNSESSARSKLKLNVGVKMRGDILIQLLHEGMFSDMKIGRANFHTGFVPEDGWLRLTKQDWDELCKNDDFPNDFTVDLYFEDISTENSEATAKIRAMEPNGVWSINFAALQAESIDNKAKRMLARNDRLDGLDETKETPISSPISPVNEQVSQVGKKLKSEMSSPPVLETISRGERRSLDSASTMSTAYTSKTDDAKASPTAGPSPTSKTSPSSTMEVKGQDYEIGPVAARASFGKSSMRLTNALLEKLVQMEVNHDITEETAHEEELFEEEEIPAPKTVTEQRTTKTDEFGNSI